MTNLTKNASQISSNGAPVNGKGKGTLKTRIGKALGALASAPTATETALAKNLSDCKHALALCGASGKSVASTTYKAPKEAQGLVPVVNVTARVLPEEMFTTKGVASACRRAGKKASGSLGIKNADTTDKGGYIHAEKSVPGTDLANALTYLHDTGIIVQ